MKKTILSSVCLSALLFVAGNALAQDAGKTANPQTTVVKAPPAAQVSAEEKADRTVKRLTVELTLTDEQQKQIHEVVLANLKQEEVDMATANASVEKEMELKNARKETKRAAFKKILNPEQYAKVEARWKTESEKENAMKK
ncbi:MAG: hypothetical protein ABI855_20105 [Bacteroidota bacterium]